VTRGVFVGVDVAKDRLDEAFRPGGEKLIVPNDRRGITRLVTTIGRLKPECVELETSDGLSGDCGSGWRRRNCRSRW